MVNLDKNKIGSDFSRKLGYTIIEQVKTDQNNAFAKLEN